MDYAWPPYCARCDGLGCADCDGEGCAHTWNCAACGSHIDTRERPARIGERGSYTCGECDGAPVLPGLEEAV
jgi:predicted SprT family Zn-dependent metalloprotease